MSPLSTYDLKRIFQKLDKNGDDLVSLEELSWLLERINNGSVHHQFSKTELESLVGKSSLNFDEFLFFYESISSKHNDEIDDEVEEIIISDLVKAFKVFDQNDDGFISCEELQSVLIRLGLMEENSTDKDCKTMINSFDANSDGQLDFEEFKTMMLLTITS
ncbi:hypothetical protein G4B88_013201 [Cannabis sativa]|uniref:EF-hand domain-containing protein n=1 Tax=Cannabis sativa TaxID=3483 RepID=A0A7J6GZF1_CANSA|nr:hypothetical protein G4B88_013201 [Cannabis sativa]